MASTFTSLKITVILQFYTQQKLPFKNKAKIKKISYKQKLREFVTRVLIKRNSKRGNSHQREVAANGRDEGQ